MSDPDKKPNAYKVALYAGIGIAICAVGRYAYDYAIAAFPAYEQPLRIIAILLFSVLIVYCSIRPIMNEAGDYWR